MTFGSLLSLALATVRNPREAATTLLSVGIPSAAILPAFLLVVVLSVLLTVLGQTLVAQPIEGGGLPPLATTALLCGLQAAYIFGVYRTGRAMGGTGSLAETAVLIVFLQFVLLLAQVVQLALLVMAPPLAGIFVMATIVLTFWIVVNFIDVLHGYGSLLKSLGLFVMVSIGVALVFMLMLGLAGVSLQGPA